MERNKRTVKNPKRSRRVGTALQGASARSKIAKGSGSISSVTSPNAVAGLPITNRRNSRLTVGATSAISSGPVYRKGRKRAKILFVTGTGTGVGKTVATSLLLCYLREAGVKAMGVKLFSCGGREDAEKLQEIQGAVLSADEVNPFSFKAPLAPLVAQRLEGRRVTLGEAVEALKRVLPRCDTLLVEGCGGLLVPLGDGFSFVDVIRRLGGDILVVGPNQLGVLNHVLLTLNALPRGGREQVIRILLMGQEHPDSSAGSNARILGEIIGAKMVFLFPFLGHKPLVLTGLQKCCKKFKKTLAALVE